MNLTTALRKRPPKVGPPIVSVSIMYCDNGVMRFLRSAGDSAVFGPAAESACYTQKFKFDATLDPQYIPGSDLYAVIWKRYDDGRTFQQITFDPISFSGRAFRDEWGVSIDMTVRLDKRQWKLRVAS